MKLSLPGPEAARRRRGSGQILIVRHGRDRGRLGGYLQPQLQYLWSRAPSLAQAIRFHDTGSSGERPDLSDVRAVLFWLADPLRELYPECYAEALVIAREAQAKGIRTINPPDALSNAIKSVQARLWSQAGIPTPPTTRFGSRAELEALVAGGEYPLLIKSDLLHSQEGMHLCCSAEEARALPDEAIHYPGAVAPFVDTRDGYRSARPGSVWARYYHKKRVLVLGDIVHPRHAIFSTDPIVSLKRSTFRPYRRRARRYLLPFRRWDVQCIREDNAFFTGALEHPQIMRRAVAALGLGFAAIDYSTLADGSVVLWEANPYFALLSSRKYLLQKERHFQARYHAFYDALRSFFEDLLREAP